MKRYFVYNSSNKPIDNFVINLNDEQYAAVKEVIDGLGKFKNKHAIEEIPDIDEILTSFRNHLVDRGILVEYFKLTHNFNQDDEFERFVNNEYSNKTEYCREFIRFLLQKNVERL